MGSSISSLFCGLQRHPSTSRQRTQPSRCGSHMSTQPSFRRENSNPRTRLLSQKYSCIPDNYTSLDQVTNALRDSGLESSNLIVGIDFTKSNEWTGKRSFNNQSLHTISSRPNPYEQAISIVGKVLAPFDEDNLIPCFGFGDATTHDQEVFSFHSNHSPCQGFEEVLACYRKIVPNLILSGPTSFAPIVKAAVDIVESSGGQYHVLVIIADGQVTRSINTKDGDLSPQEKKTIDAIVAASSYPLSIVLVGVGDGPWDDMQKFDDKIPRRFFDNFQFVNFTAIMERYTNQAEKEAAFALAALMEIPVQYKATVELGFLGRMTRINRQVMPRPPPLPITRRQYSVDRTEPTRTESRNRTDPTRTESRNRTDPTRTESRNRTDPTRTESRNNDRNQACPVCLTNSPDLAFGCGHLCCRNCGMSLSTCPICRTFIRTRLRIYTG